MAPPPEFYEMAAAGLSASEISRAVGKSADAVTKWARATHTTLTDGRSTRGACGEEVRALVALNDGLPLQTKGSRYALYQLQRKSSFKRGISWEMTFAEWLDLWSDSGKLESRGPRKGQFCMGRNGDVGPYKVGNVRIISVEQNMAEALANKGTPNNVGTGRGWKLHPNRAKPYCACFRGKTLGYFATAEEARSTYLAAVQKYHESKTA